VTDDGRAYIFMYSTDLVWWRAVVNMCVYFDDFTLHQSVRVAEFSFG